mgnify:CR=1 FL=1
MEKSIVLANEISEISKLNAFVDDIDGKNVLTLEKKL